MELLNSVDNFLEGGVVHEINSPRTLEACLRLGLDPAELAPKNENKFKTKDLPPELVKVKYDHFERKRKEKIAAVISEREVIMKYGLKKHSSPNHSQSIDKVPNMNQMVEPESEAPDDEARRMEALRKRQEKEIAQIIEREQLAALAQQKIKRAEDMEMKKKQMHDREVAKQKQEDEKKAAARGRELKVLEEQEAANKRDVARKEKQQEAKMEKERKITERKMIEEARARDAERMAKIEAAQQKTEALIQSQFDMAEENRRKMIERETRVKDQLEAMKVKKREEVESAKDKATTKILEAMDKFNQIHEAKKDEFAKRQQEAHVRAREKSVIERENVKKQIEDRDKKEKQRINRLIDSFKGRQEHREAIIERSDEKQSIFGKIQAEKDYNTIKLKFSTELKLADKQENVQRVARQTEFQRLQTLKKIEDEDIRFEAKIERRKDMFRKHCDEQKKLSDSQT